MSVTTKDMGGIAEGGGREALRGAILIAGPTASGKSALALGLARELDGAIVNADSMQVYSVLQKLTARPEPADLAAAPHHLYGHVHPSQAYSTGGWLRDVARLIDSGALGGRRPIFTGGTGLYFKALTEGLSRMPEIAPEIRERWRARLSAEGAQALHGELHRADPRAAARIRPADGQRIVRALEVLEASGQSIVDWQGERGRPLVNADAATMIVIEPARAELAERIERRFASMVAEGALAEVEALLRLRLSDAIPAMKAIGIAELRAVIEGRSSAEEAVRHAATATRRYAKRQSTWFRTQLGPQWHRISDAAELKSLDFKSYPHKGAAG